MLTFLLLCVFLILGFCAEILHEIWKKEILLQTEGEHTVV